ncbi:N-acetylmuramate alpha-1-phosphate uridylyltransferase MurU [Wenzhouxiangella sp. EGI_FJ10305]|uniref:N-acetylmuramate alpha-1-phosphate uridylyltransferase MurU n=1 Tax=Wenzhouxiangella sp. EGI_FJ10305 TaxID=3243768 RepID=UPI0035DAF36E
MRAMILAAGRGERLRPLTDNTPKPLIEVGGKPLIVHHLERLAAAGFEDVVINLGWLGGQIAERLEDGRILGLQIRYSQEPPGALETAGGIVEALPLLGEKPFLVVSADVMTDYPFGRLREIELAGQAHLVLVDNPPHHRVGDFGLESGRVYAGNGKRLTFSGIAVFEPSLFAGLSPGRRPLRPVLEQAIAAGRVGGEHYAGMWADIGTPERLADVQQSSDPDS